MKRLIRAFYIIGIAILLAGSGTVLAAQSLKIEEGKKVTLTYKLLVGGKVVETADSEKPFSFVEGKHQVVPGLEKALIGLQTGDKKTIRVSAKEAFGERDPKALREIAKDRLPPELPQKAGTPVEARAPDGRSMVVTIAEVKDKTVVLDFNHPLAGKELEFQVEVLNVA